MNPFRESITQLGFLLWSMVLLLACIFVLVGRSRGWLDIGKGSGTFGEIIAYIIIILFIVFSFLVLVRRLQNVNWPSFLSILYFVPIVGFLFCLVLLLVPSKTK